MKTKFVVKLEELSSSRFLTKDVQFQNKTVPFAFRPFKYNHDIAYFDTKEEAIAACEEAFTHEGTQGLPVILEVIV